MKLSVATTSFLTLLATMAGSFAPAAMADDSTTRVLMESTVTFDGPNSATTSLTGSQILYFEETFQAAFNAVNGGSDAGAITISTPVVTDYTVMTESVRRRGLRKSDDASRELQNPFILWYPYFTVLSLFDGSCKLCSPDRRLDENGESVSDGEEDNNNRALGDSETLGPLLCDMLNAGHDESFHGVSNCKVTLFTAV